MATRGKDDNAVKVVARFRPMSKDPSQCVGGLGVEYLSETGVKTSGAEGHPFEFDRVFQPNARQEDVFEYTGRQIVEDVFDGYNGTIFAYGQTGSGKSHTMMGPSTAGLQGYCEDSHLKGIIPRVVDMVFSTIDATVDKREFIVKASYVEVYMERVKDLLDTTKTNLNIREDFPGGHGIYIENVTEEYVADAAEVFRVLQTGASNRVTAATRMNAESSRSHSILQITVTQTLECDKRTGKLFLVDLAGSERAGKTGAEGQQMEEAKLINKSLSALGNVINALTDKNQAHIPYRDSKLTRLLQESVGGNSRTTLIVCCSPSKYNEGETLSTLRFGERAKRIKNHAKVNREFTVKELKMLLAKAEEEIAMLRGKLGSSAPAKGANPLKLDAEGHVDLTFMENQQALMNQIADLTDSLDENKQALVALTAENASLRDQADQWEKEYLVLSEQTNAAALVVAEENGREVTGLTAGIKKFSTSSDDIVATTQRLIVDAARRPPPVTPAADDGLASLYNRSSLAGLPGTLSAEARRDIPIPESVDREHLWQSLLAQQERAFDLDLALGELRELYAEEQLDPIGRTGSAERATALELEAEVQLLGQDNEALREQLLNAERESALRSDRLKALKEVLLEERRRLRLARELAATEKAKGDRDYGRCAEELEYWKGKVLSRRDWPVAAPHRGVPNNVVKVIKGGRQSPAPAHISPAQASPEREGL